MDKGKDDSMEFYLAQLNKLIESKKKENESLKTIVDVMSKNSDNQTKTSSEISKNKK